MHGFPHPDPAWYPHTGYDYAPYDSSPIYDGEFVGAPPSSPKVITFVPEKQFPTALVVGLVVAGAVATYFIYSANTGRVQKKINRAAMKILGEEAKRTGTRAARHAGRAAADFVARTIDKHAGPSRQKVMHYRAVPG